jgi:3-hydroxyacyl-[acyl-carrier-protein] dehydratase
MAEVAAPPHAVGDVVAERDVNAWVIRARKEITDHDPEPAGPFPGATIYPGVFVVESLRRAVSEGLGAPCDIVSVRSAQFLLPLLSGDVLVLDATVTPLGNGTLAVTAHATIEHGDIPAAMLHLLLRAPGVVDAAAA